MAGTELRSTAFTDQAALPARYSHANGDLSPPLEWLGVPEGTAELALICEDPDAPTGTFTHWLLAGISPSVDGVAEGEQPSGAVVGTNDFGEVGYGGPHPPAGDDPHRYIFRLYALSEPSQLPTGHAPEDFHRAVEDRTLESGDIVGTYGR